MARGDKRIYNQQEQQSYANSNAAAQQGAANQAAAFTPALSGYSSELAQPGFTDSEKQAMQQATTGSLAGAFGAARTRLANQTAQTGNTAGENATEEQLAREQGQQNAQALGALQGQFAKARQQGEQNALQGLGNLYGTSANATNAALGNASRLVGTQQKVALTPGFWSRMLGSALGGGSSITGGGNGL